MAKYWLVRIQGTGSGGAVSIYLTRDGLVTGAPCKIAFPAADVILSPVAGNTTVGNTGDPFTEFPLVATGGRTFEITAAFMATTVFEDLKELIDFVVSEGTNLTITATGEPGTISAEAKPDHAPIPLGFDSFVTNQIRNVKIRLKTAPPAA